MPLSYVHFILACMHLSNRESLLRRPPPRLFVETMLILIPNIEKTHYNRSTYK